MDAHTFRSYLTRGKQIGGEYGAGYQRGLRRHYHGEAFGTAEQHEQWLHADAGRPDRSELARGYRAGFAGQPPQIP